MTAIIIRIPQKDVTRISKPIRIDMKGQWAWRYVREDEKL